MRQRLQRNVAGIGRFAVMALGLVVLGGARGRGDGREDLAPQKAHLELRALYTGGRATYTSGGREGDIAVGESQVWSLIVSPGEAGCATSVVVPAVPDGQVPEPPAQLWEARLTVQSATLEQIELDVEWQRYVRGKDAAPHAIKGDRRSVRLREGEHHLLDFVEVRSKPGWESCYSLALEVKASVAEDPALAERRIAYDLWLVDEGPGGPSTTRRWQMAGKQGQARDFDFEPLHRSITGEATAGRLDTRVFGQVRGRVQDDGSLEVALLAERQDMPADRHWALGGAGEKRVRVTAGETIRLELPAPSPDVSQETDRSELKRDVDHGILVGLGERTVSLVLTARSVD